MSEKTQENLAISDSESMSDRLKSLIKKLNIKSANQFAERIGVAASIVNNVVSGRRGNLSVETIQRVAAAFPRVNTDWLITGRGEALRPAGQAQEGSQIQYGNTGNTVGKMEGGSLSYAAEADCARALEACRGRVKELEGMVADKQLIIELLQKGK